MKRFFRIAGCTLTVSGIIGFVIISCTCFRTDRHSSRHRYWSGESVLLWRPPVL